MTTHMNLFSNIYVRIIAEKNQIIKIDLTALATKSTISHVKLRSQDVSSDLLRTKTNTIDLLPEGVQK